MGSAVPCRSIAYAGFTASCPRKTSDWHADPAESDADEAVKMQARRQLMTLGPRVGYYGYESVQVLQDCRNGGLPRARLMRMLRSVGPEMGASQRRLEDRLFPGNWSTKHVRKADEYTEGQRRLKARERVTDESALVDA
jgi:hypothetical protein